MKYLIINWAIAISIFVVVGIVFLATLGIQKGKYLKPTFILFWILCFVLLHEAGNIFYVLKYEIISWTLQSMSTLILGILILSLMSNQKTESK